MARTWFVSDEKLKEKRDPTGFRDAILQGISETEDLEQVCFGARNSEFHILAAQKLV